RDARHRGRAPRADGGAHRHRPRPALRVGRYGRAPRPDRRADHRGAVVAHRGDRPRRRPRRAGRLGAARAQRGAHPTGRGTGDRVDSPVPDGGPAPAPPDPAASRTRRGPVMREGDASPGAARMPADGAGCGRRSTSTPGGSTASSTGRAQATARGGRVLFAHATDGGTSRPAVTATGTATRRATTHHSRLPACETPVARTSSCHVTTGPRPHRRRWWSARTAARSTATRLRKMTASTAVTPGALV